MLVILYFTLKDNFIGVISIIDSLDIKFILLALLFMGIYGIFRCLSLHTMIKHYDKNFSFIKTIRNALITVFFNGTTPFATGGQPVQIYYLKKEGLKLEDSIAVVLQNFVVYQFVLILFGAFAIILNNVFNLFNNVTLLSQLTVLGFLINFVVMIALLLISYTHKLDNFIVSKVIDILHKLKIIKNEHRLKKRVQKKVYNLYNSACELKKHKTIYIKCFVYNFLAFIFLYTIPYILILSVPEEVNMSYIASFVGIAYVMLIGSFVPIPGGSGGLEFAFVKFFGSYIINYVTATLVIIWRFITYYFGMIFGFIAIGTHNIKK